MNWFKRQPKPAPLSLELSGAIERLNQQIERSKAQSDEFDRWVALWRQLSSPTFPRAKLWEDAQVGRLLVTRPEDTPPLDATPLDATLDDPLQQWLWKKAWDACAETGNWDLLTAAAGIARGIRTEGVPLSNGLRAAAGEYRGSE